MREFETEEQEETYEALVAAGREQLLSYGPTKTNVSDVTDPVGVAKSTFYLYFESKADLYLEIFRREFAQLNSRIDEEIKQVDGPTAKLETVFRCYREFAEENPFVQQMLAAENYRQMFRKNVSPERFEEVQKQGMAELLPFIREIQEQSDGLASETDPAMIVGVMGVIGLVVQNSDEFEEHGEEYYEHVQELLIEALARGLTASPR
jgi:AcrR family transcriptional regulator